MESTVPIATDNIYKFYALFGLSIFISSLLTLAYIHIHFNEIIPKEYIEVETLKVKADLSQEEKIRKDVLERKTNIDVSDKNTFAKILGGFGGLGVLLMIFGFSRWQKRIQPRQDMLLDLQIEKIKREISALNG